jgi:hypothetical protein
LAKQVVYLAPGILAKLDADPAIRQALLARMERDAELAAQTGQPIPGRSASYADHFDDLIAEKAAHLGISRGKMEVRLGRGDATLLGLCARCGSRCI